MANTGPLPTAEIGDFAVPRHVAIIMDGNGRWAAARGLPRGEGHRRGVEALRRTVRAAGDLGIDFLTIFSFSAENWSRPPAEILKFSPCGQWIWRRSSTPRAAQKADNARPRGHAFHETA